MSRICFTPRNIFKFHSRLIAIFFCSLFSILFVILVNAIIVGPTITFITSVAVYYWQVYAPVIGAIEVLLNLNNATAGNFDADKIKLYVEVFQEMIFKNLNHQVPALSSQRKILGQYPKLGPRTLISLSVEIIK